MSRPERDEELFELDPEDRLLLPEDRAPEELLLLEERTPDERLLLPVERAPDERLLLPVERAPDERLLLPVDRVDVLLCGMLLDLPTLEDRVPTLVVERVGTARLPVLEPALLAVPLLVRVVRVTERVVAAERVEGSVVRVVLVRDVPAATRLVRVPESFRTLRVRLSSVVLEAPDTPPVFTIERVPMVPPVELATPRVPRSVFVLRPPRVSLSRLVSALRAIVDPRGVLYVPRATDTPPAEPPYHAYDG